MDVKSFLIGALGVAAIILGYMYYETTRHSFKIDAPGVKIEGH